VIAYSAPLHSAFIGRRAVERGHGKIVEPQIDSELRALMHHVVQKMNGLGARLFPPDLLFDLGQQLHEALFPLGLIHSADGLGDLGHVHGAEFGSAHGAELGLFVEIIG
jgi:hypothetical protein